MSLDGRSMLVPRSKGELVDLLGWMIMTSPRFSTEIVHDGDMDLAFDTLAKGIEATNLPAVARSILNGLSDEACAHFQAGNERAGNRRLHEMQIFLRKRGWTPAGAAAFSAIVAGGSIN
jgi:hypothetical protein